MGSSGKEHCMVVGSRRFWSRRDGLGVTGREQAAQRASGLGDCDFIYVYRDEMQSMETDGTEANRREWPS